MFEHFHEPLNVPKRARSAVNSASGKKAGKSAHRHIASVVAASSFSNDQKIVLAFNTSRGNTTVFSSSDRSDMALPRVAVISCVLLLLSQGLARAQETVGDAGQALLADAAGGGRALLGDDSSSSAQNRTKDYTYCEDLKTLCL